MALRTYVKEAWEDIADLQTPEVNGARESADCARNYQDGAWEEVWNAIQWMKELANTFSVATCGYGSSTDHDYTLWYVFSDESDGGYATWYLEGDFTNPTVSFEYEGFFNYETSSGETRYASAGSVSLYTRTTDGTESYPTALSSIGTSSGSSEGTYETTLSGSFDRIGFKIDLKSWSSVNYPLYSIDIWNFLIDGKECLPSEDCVNE